ncbi:MAG TPA: ABC transporter substrate-binding protein [bacterium]|nr:ABC transporter substrate-binding protein [bacterium]
MLRRFAVVLVMVLAVGVLGVQRSSGQTGSQVVVDQGVDTESMDPLFTQARFSDNIMLTMFETLVTRDSQMHYSPRLAESWKILSPTVWQFKLRKGIRFHDSEPFNAQAVKYTINRLYDPAIKAPSFLKGFFEVDRVDAVDDYTVNIVTKKPAPLMLEWLVNFYMVAPKYYSTVTPAQAALRPIGTGPYMFKEWVHDDHATVTINPNYWGAKPKLQTVIFRPVPEAGTRIADLLSGGADIIVNVPPDQVNRINGSPLATVKTVEGGRDIFIGMRTDRAVFKDLRVRQAMNYAVDVDTILRSLLNGKGQRMATVVNAYANPAVKPYPYDANKARALLSDAGWKLENGVLVKDGQPLSVTLDTPVGRYIRDKEIAEAVGSYLQAVGVQVKVNPLAWPVYAKKMFDDVNPADMYLLGLGSSFDGQDEIRYLEKDYGYNPTFWNNADFEKLYGSLNLAVDPNQRTQTLYKLQQIAHDDPPIIYLYKQIDYYGVSKRINWEPRRDELIMLEGASVNTK